MVGEVNSLQENEEMTAEEQPVDAVTDTEEAPAEGVVEDVPAEEDKTAALEAEVQEKNDRILRLQADFENFRRRTAKEKEELAAVITQNLLTDLLPLLDNFERAMAVEQTDVEDGTITQVLQKGYQAKGRVIRPAMVQVAGN